MSEPVIVTRDGAVARVTVDRPEKRNALDAAVRAGIIGALDTLAADPEVRVVVVTGAGEKAFVAGADLAEFAARSPEEQREAMQRAPLFDRLSAFPKPTIAMIGGWALGGGCELALACDLRIASDRARIGQPEINLGLIPGGGGTQRLARIAGGGAAMRLVLTGEPIDAAEALRLGIVDYLVPAAELERETERIAHTIARHSPLALRLAKEAVRAAGELPCAAGLERERELFLAAFASEDGREGVRAFLDKRDPHFTGR